MPSLLICFTLGSSADNSKEIFTIEETSGMPDSGLMTVGVVPMAVMCDTGEKTGEKTNPAAKSSRKRKSKR